MSNKYLSVEYGCLHWCQSSVIALAFLLSGCGPAINCTQGVDGAQFIKEISAESPLIESIAPKVVQLVSQCTPSKEQQDLIDKAVIKIATEGSASLQMDFYVGLSEKASNAKSRMDFINQSTLLSGTAKASVEKVFLVEFEKLGKRFDQQSASRPILDALSSIHALDGDAELVRQVDSDDGPLVLVRSTFSDGFVEASEMRVFSFTSGARVPTPTESFEFVSLSTSDNAFRDYFFSCQNLAGDLCGIRDSRFAVNESGKLRYVASALYADVEGGKCRKELSVLRVKGRLVEHVQSLDSQDGVKCAQPPTPDSHGDPFKAYLEKDILAKLIGEGGYPDLAGLVNIKRKDAADTALKDKLLLQEGKWKSRLLQRAIEPIDFSTVTNERSLDPVLKELSKLTDKLDASLSNLKWLRVAGANSSKSDTRVVGLESSLASFRQRLAAIAPGKLPEPVPELKERYQFINFEIQRMAQPGDSGIPRLPDLPYIYMGFRVPQATVGILNSPKELTDRPTLVRVLVSGGESPIRMMQNGFLRDVWFYRVLSDEEIATYDDYRKKVQEYQRAMSLYNSSQNEAAVTANTLIGEIRTLDESMRKLAKSQM